MRWLFALLAASQILGGCAGMLGNVPMEKMSAKEIHELAKIKDANIACIVVNSPYGKGSALFLNVDKGVLPAGGTVTCDDACKCSVSTSTKP